MHLRYTAAIDLTGDGIVSTADTIQAIGADMYSYLRGLIDSGKLSGDGIAQALEQSQTRWNKACDEFAEAERKFGLTTKESYANMIAADYRGASYF